MCQALCIFYLIIMRICEVGGRNWGSYEINNLLFHTAVKRQIVTQTEFFWTWTPLLKFFFNFNFLNWSIVDLPYCVSSSPCYILLATSFYTIITQSYFVFVGKYFTDKIKSLVRETSFIISEVLKSYFQLFFLLVLLTDFGIPI